jgi:hypothetical protein
LPVVWPRIGAAPARKAGMLPTVQPPRRLPHRATWHRASRLITRYGEEASGHAIRHALRHRLRRDLRAEADWLCILDAIEEICRDELLPGEWLQ